MQLDGFLLSTEPGHVAEQVRRAIRKGTYEAPERVLVREALDSRDRVLEIGAGVGLISLICSRIVGQDQVLSFEPNPVAADIVRRNYALNGMTPQLRQKAVTLDGNPVDFNISDNIFSSSLYVRRNVPTKTVKVESESISNVIEQYKPTAIVMDVEGAEVDLLPIGTLPGVKKIILELHPHIVGAIQIDDLRNHLTQIGFRRVDEIEQCVYYLR